MKREDAKDLFINNKSINTLSKMNGLEIIDKIYDDIDKQICKNCIHYDENDKVCVLLDMGVINDTFGCKAFEQKED